jgi:hypothetical protein
MPYQDLRRIDNGQTGPAGGPATPESRGFGKGAVDPAAPQSGAGDEAAAQAAIAQNQQAAAEAEVGLDAFGGEGATVIEGVGIDETPGANSRGGATEPERTEILDPASSPVTITTDTFDVPGATVTPCAGAAGGGGGGGGGGGLAGQALSQLLGGLPEAAQQMVNATGLTGALAGVAQEIDGEIAGALGQISNTLNEAAGALFTDVANTVTNIPGLGPAIESITKNISAFNSDLQGAFATLDPGLQQVIGTAVNAVGANINNPLIRTGFTTLFTPAQARGIIQGLQLPNNPATQIAQIARASGVAAPIMNEFFGNTVFSQLQSRALTASTQLNRAIVPNGTQFQVRLQLPNINPAVTQVVNGVIQNPNTMISQAQARINQTVGRIPTGGFSIRV